MNMNPKGRTETKDARWNKGRLGTLFLSIGFYVLSLFFTAYCTKQFCRGSVEALLIGWLAVFGGPIGYAWLANPLLFFAWFLFVKKNHLAWVPALFASVFCLFFLFFPLVLEDEAGNMGRIIRIGPGYWLWFLSCLSALLGSLYLGYVKSGIK